MDRFCFWSVGQGLFYTGLLDDGKYNFVYDCGAESFDSAKRAVEKFYDDCVLNDVPLVLDFVIISCLNAEHLNGLYFLSQKCRIKKICLPYISHDKLTVKTILTCAVFANEYYSRDSEEAYYADELLGFLLRLYGVSNEKGFDDLPQIELLGKERENDMILSLNGHKYWQFVMINNSGDLDELVNLTTAIEGIVGKFDSIKDFLQSSKDNFVKIASVYREAVKVNHAISRTILLHYPLYALEFTCAGIYYYRDEVANSLPITMLTGDADIDDSAKARIDTETYGYGVYALQLPNHGSLKGWEQVKGCFRMFDVHNLIISHGEDSEYNSPAPEVIKEIKEKFYALSTATNAQTVKYWIRKYDKKLDY